MRQLSFINHSKQILRPDSAFLWIVLLPMLIGGIYYTAIASDRYVSESRLTIKQTGSSDAGLSILGLFTGSNPVAREDAFYLKEYIHSFDMLDYLDKKLNLKKAYQDKKADPISRLSTTATKEEFFEYYKKHVEVNYDEHSSVITIRVQAFKPEFARGLNQAIVEQSELFINAVSHKIAAEQMLFVEHELARTKDRLQTAKNRILRFQNVHNVLDPVEQAKAMAGFVTQMETNIAAQEAELKNLLTYLNEYSYQVIAVKNRIETLREQIAKEKNRISGKDSSRLNQVSAQFMELRFDAEFITDIYKATLSAMEKTRVDASKKLKNLVILASPTLPEEAEYPRRAYIIAVMFVVLMLCHGIFSLITATIREHREDA